MTDHGPQGHRFSPGGWLRAPEPDVSHLPANCLTTRQLVARIDDEYRRTHPVEGGADSLAAECYLDRANRKDQPHD